MKKCKSCKVEFEPIKSIQSRCIECTIEHARKLEYKAREKKRKATNKETRESLKNLSHYKKELQTIVNAIVRTLDGKNCIACGQHKEKLDAGHFYPTSTDGGIRFNLWNIHGECRYCNSYLHGNLSSYRKGIETIFGEDTMEEILDLPNRYKYKIEKQMVKDAIPKAKDCLKELKELNKEFSIKERVYYRKKFNNYIGLY